MCVQLFIIQTVLIFNIRQLITITRQSFYRCLKVTVGRYNYDQVIIIHFKIIIIIIIIIIILRLEYLNMHVYINKTHVT